MFEIMFGLIFVFIFGSFIFVFIKGIKQNKNAPLLHVDAEIVDKEKVRHSSNNTSSHTRYYLSFKVRSGDIIRLSVTSDVFNYLFVGDTGVLEFKGTQFVGFGKKDDQE